MQRLGLNRAGTHLHVCRFASIVLILACTFAIQNQAQPTKFLIQKLQRNQSTRVCLMGPSPPQATLLPHMVPAVLASIQLHINSFPALDH